MGMIIVLTHMIFKGLHKAVYTQGQHSININHHMIIHLNYHTTFMITTFIYISQRRKSSYKTID